MEDIERKFMALDLQDRANWCVIDCQFLKTKNGKLIVKEVSFNSHFLDLREPLTFLVQSPYLPTVDQRDLSNGLCWSEGKAKLTYVINVLLDLLKHNTVVIVADEFQQREITRLIYKHSKLHIPVINIRNWGLTKVEGTVADADCSNHGNRQVKDNRWICSQANVKLMTLWIKMTF